MNEQSDLIEDYFEIPNKVEKIKEHVRHADEMFWERSFISSPMAIDEAGNRSGVKPFQLLVDDLVVFDEFMEKYISMIQYQHKCFIQFINNMDNDEVRTIKRKYLFKLNTYVPDELEMKIYSKCMDINKETKEIFKDMADMINDVTDNYRSTLNELLESLV